MALCNPTRRFVGADRAARIAGRLTFIPTHAKLVPGPAGCAVYTYTQREKLLAMGFRGSAARPEFHYVYQSEARRAEAIAEFFQSVTASQAFKATRRAEKSAWVNPLKVGDLLYTSWGYDQTNTDFYAVTKVSGRRVAIREIAGDYQETGFLSGRSWPAVPLRFVGEETAHVAQPSGRDGGVYVKVGHHHAWPEQGQTHYTSHYA